MEHKIIEAEKNKDWKKHPTGMSMVLSNYIINILTPFKYRL